MTYRMVCTAKRLSLVLPISLAVLLPLLAQDFDAEKLRFASAQHDIIQVLLKEKNFEAVFPELEKIYSLRMSAEHEEKVLREIRIVTDTFLQNRRSDLAIRILERGIQGIGQNRSKAALYQELGYVYRLQGNDLKAMECFRRAQDFGGKINTPRPY